jgi:hypothetical protein
MALPLDWFEVRIMQLAAPSQLDTFEQIAE